MHGKIDTLEGLKENVIVGRLIPAGTGNVLSGLRRISEQRDVLIRAEFEKQRIVAEEERKAKDAENAAKAVEDILKDEAEEALKNIPEAEAVDKTKEADVEPKSTDNSDDTTDA
jgi:hypothetical protein